MASKTWGGKDIVLFGIQGSGKGTQSQAILQEFPEDFAYLEMGQIFRSLTSGPNIIGDYVNSIMASGHLVPDIISCHLFETALETVGTKKVIFDGFPRKWEQAYSFFDVMARQERDYEAVFLELSEEMAIKRVLGRGRSDDTIDVIKQRMANYYEKTLPVIEHIKALGKLTVINADDSMENVTLQIKSLIESCSTSSPRL